MASLIILIAFVWTTYDPRTFRMLSGDRLEARDIPPPAESRPVVMTEQTALRNKSVRR
jgi:hypothetical protein